MIELPVIPVSQNQRKPDWLRVKLPVGKEYRHVRSLVDEHKLHTICESGNCPNMGECWGAGTATFMILGNICTRSCSFCAVATGRPLAVDTDEPNRVANSVKLMQVKHCVITSVDRDDLRMEDRQFGLKLFKLFVERVQRLLWRLYCQISKVNGTIWIVY